MVLRWCILGVVLSVRRHVAVLGVEAVCSAEAVSSGGWYVEFKQAVVVRYAAYSESFLAVRCGRVAVVGVYVHSAFGF